MAYTFGKFNAVLFAAGRAERYPDCRSPVLITEHEILKPLGFEVRAVAAQKHLTLIAPVGFHLSVCRAFIHKIKEANKGVMATGTSR
jgi:hypothetical protein